MSSFLNVPEVGEIHDYKGRMTKEEDLTFESLLSLERTEQVVT